MKRIKLTQKQFAIIDNKDFEKISKYKWWAEYKKSMKTYYAVANLSKRDKSVFMHRLILNAAKEKMVDHKNHDTLDNRRSNLRLCTNTQNQGNSRIRKKGTSKFKGVHFNKIAKKWQAGIRIDKKLTYLGCFKNEINAAIAYDNMAKKHFKEFSSLNFKTKKGVKSE